MGLTKAQKQYQQNSKAKGYCCGWRRDGYPCGSIGMWEQKDLLWCANHLDHSKPAKELSKEERMSLQSRR